MLRRKFLKLSTVIGLGALSVNRLVWAGPFSHHDRRGTGRPRRRLPLVGHPGAGCTTPPGILNFMEYGISRLPY